MPARTQGEEQRLERGEGVVVAGEDDGFGDLAARASDLPDDGDALVGVAGGDHEAVADPLACARLCSAKGVLTTPSRRTRCICNSTGP